MSLDYPTTLMERWMVVKKGPFYSAYPIPDTTFDYLNFIN